MPSVDFVGIDNNLHNSLQFIVIKVAIRYGDSGHWPPKANVIVTTVIGQIIFDNDDDLN